MTAQRFYSDYVCDISDAVNKACQFVEGICFEKFEDEEKALC